MNNINISRTDLSTKLHECYAMARFLSISVELVLEENGTFTDKCPVPHGAGSSIDALADMILAIEQAI